MKYRPIIYAALFLLLSPTLAMAAKRATDGFDYSSMQDLRAKWNITYSGFSTDPSIELTTKDVKEGKKALLLTSSPVPTGTLARIDLDITPSIPLKQVKQISFWLYIENQQSLASAGLHCADATWANYYSGNRWTSQGNGWQKVTVSTDSLDVGGGKPSWDNMTQMRISFWFVGGGQPTKIILDDMSWSTTVERDQNLNRKWYDD